MYIYLTSINYICFQTGNYLTSAGHNEGGPFQDPSLIRQYYSAVFVRRVSGQASIIIMPSHASFSHSYTSDHRCLCNIKSIYIYN